MRTKRRMKKKIEQNLMISHRRKRRARKRRSMSLMKMIMNCWRTIISIFIVGRRAKSLRRDTEEEPFGLSDEEEFVGSGKVGRTTEEKLKHSLFGDDEVCMQASQKGLIGITLNSDWYVPVSKEKSDQDVACRGLDFMFGWP
ncbi:hypothetical protein AAZV13_04G163200 [Glycine max]|uniref:uncharacterized protein LOC114409996 n=1 Tax=Glycine soja TaxID=3848 RepID=UPI0003DEBCC1|nr:uncharacterized protein LOC114409996 [Glycine soja]XP_028229521.1 uncharacterized protein LOC114409996 [Glycine soja]XP_028229522.1 uncharacterized protein LOC114409996 [Glycine soja]